ncbi:hypothetical protein [Streptomyces sp. NPDC005969]|uniref:hypothetical protein n=1 Tax=Streptomyces sp. NPDC005969 TaxID=3156722 RepID=UPI0033F019E9
MTTFQTPEQTLLARAHQLDKDDPLEVYRATFLEAPDSDLVAYLDGNSLGRPLRAAAERMDRFIREQWAGRMSGAMIRPPDSNSTWEAGSKAMY